MKQSAINVVWLKRDLRTTDHDALNAAIDAGLPFLLLYCFEPSLIESPVHSTRHWRFVYESLMEIKTKCGQANIPVIIAHQEALSTFEKITEHFKINTVYAYQETGIKITFDRDKQMDKWFKSKAIVWKEFTANGIFRRLKSRHNWAENWERFMTMPIVSKQLSAAIPWQLTATEVAAIQGSALPEEFTVKDVNFQPGGSSYAWRYLNSFLAERGKHYSKHIGWPHYSRKTCSRISPYLAWGNISMRELYHALNDAYSESSFKRSLANFRSRLFWNGHFIQKFESEERIEYQNFNRAYDALDKPYNQTYYAAWSQGKTGFPLVDACSRCLAATGYINFRMRAMLVSFYTLHLWQPWQPAATWLAAQFLDFEPGIHYPQVQMQAGTTGTHLIRIYNVVKQSEERDPDALFIKTWLPELQNVPNQLVHEVWKLSAMEQELYGVQIGSDYPKPIVDLEKTAQYARQLMFDFQKTPAALVENKRILKKHVPLKNQHETKEED